MLFLGEEHKLFDSIINSYMISRAREDIVIVVPGNLNENLFRTIF